jgi:hypothetical protein
LYFKKSLKSEIADNPIKGGEGGFGGLDDFKYGRIN